MSHDIIKVSRNTANAPQNALSSQTVAFSHYNNISAQLPVNPNTGDIIVGNVKDQAKQCLTNIKAIVESIGHVMDDMVKITVFVKNIDDMDAIDEVYGTFFSAPLPTRTVVAVKALPLTDALVQMDALISNAEGTAPQAPCPLVKVSRDTQDAPSCAMSTQTVAFSHYNNLSAQLPIEPTTGKLIAGDITQQTEQCLNNIKTVLESINHVMGDIVKTTIYLKDLADIAAVNEVCSTFFNDYVPARTIVNATELPMGALVQIDTVVSHGDGTPPQPQEDSRFIVIEASNTNNAPTAPYSHTVAFSHYNHVSGQLPIDATTGEIVSADVAEQTKQCLNNIKAIIESVAHVMDDVVKVNIQVANIEDMDAIDQVYNTFFKQDLPARTVFAVSTLPMGARVQIDAVISNCEGTPPQA